MIAALARLLIALFVVTLLAGCAPSGAQSPSPVASPAPSRIPAVSTATGSLVIVGRIVTMDEPPIAEAMLIEDGTGGRGRHPGRGAGARR